jgi:hypothetical protein
MDAFNKWHKRHRDIDRETARRVWSAAQKSLIFGPERLTYIADLEAKIVHLESRRPHWAKGYTDDGVAAQSFSNALLTLWAKLGVNDQTAACEKLNELITANKENNRGQ